MVDFQKVWAVDLAIATVENVSVLTKHSALEASRKRIIASNEHSRRWVGSVRVNAVRKSHRSVVEKRFKVEKGI